MKKPIRSVNLNTKEELPDYLFNQILEYIKRECSLFDDYNANPALAANVLEERNGFFISDRQFHIIVDTCTTTFIKNISKWYKTVDISNYDEIFGFLATFLQMNNAALFKEENILYILESFVKNIDIEKITTPEVLTDFSEGPLVNAFPTCGIERLFIMSKIHDNELPAITTIRTPYSERIIDFFCTNFDKFLVKVKEYTNSDTVLDQRIILPGLQAVLPWPLDFVKSRSEYFLAPVFSLNPVVKNVEYQQVLFGKLTEDFLNLLFGLIDHNIPKVKRTDEDVLLSLISFGKM